MNRATRTPAVLLVVACLALLVGCGAGAGAAERQGSGPIQVESATIDWPANPEVAALRMRVVNTADEADALVGASSPIARSVMVHRSEIADDGRASMEEAEVVDIAANATVTFAPSGLHVMLSGITEDLQIGDEVPVDLIFAEAGTVSVVAEVVEPGSVDLEDHEH